MGSLVTGATGYVGSWLVTALLSSGHQVVAASRAPSIARPTLRLVNNVPGPLAGALRTGLDVLIALTPKVRPA